MCSCSDLRASGPSDSRDARVDALCHKLVKAHVTVTATPVDYVRPLSDRELEVLHAAARDAYAQTRALTGKPGLPPPPRRGEGLLSLRFVHVFANGKHYDPAALLAEVRGQVGWR